MALKDFNDDEIKALINNPNEFLSEQENLVKLLGVDAVTKRQFADIMKYDLNLNDKQIKAKLDQLALLKVTQIIIDI